MEAGTLFLIGTGVQAGGRVSAGLAAREAGEWNEASLRRQATEERAAGSRRAEERRRELELVLSRQRALAAASGAPTGPSIADIVGDTVERGEYLARSETYGAEARARNLQDRGALARWEGENAFIGSILGAAGDVALGVGRQGLGRGGSGSGGFFYGSNPPRQPVDYDMHGWRNRVTYG